jgi:hypothetical protein
MRNRLAIHKALVIAAQLSALACGPNPIAPSSIPTGVWGGANARLTVGDRTATFQLACAHGTLNGPLDVDSSGHFDVAGVFVRDHGGPVIENETLPEEPARYVGTVRDGKMTLTASSSQPLGTFTLVLGQQGNLVRCL